MKEIKKRAKKTPVPKEKKDEKYYERRRKNNIYAKKSRDKQKIIKKEKDKLIKKLIQTNKDLIQEISNLNEELYIYKLAVI